MLVSCLTLLLLPLLANTLPQPEAHYGHYHPYYGYHDGHYHGVECELDSHCSYSTACYSGYCRNPCAGACGYNANCRVSRELRLDGSHKMIKCRL